MRPADLQLDLDAYMGPFDLLCTVLIRRELPIADVQLAEVVVGYVQNLAAREQRGVELDPNSASEFLVLVAALLEIKAREVLAADDPLQVEQPTTLEARDEILARLIRYCTFKNASAWLRERGAEPRFWRVAARPVVRRRATYQGPVLDAVLLQRALQVLLARPDVDVRHLVGRHASVQEMASRLLAAVARRGPVSFDDAVSDCSRLDQAVAFVAMLELCKNGKVAIAQQYPLGSIELRPAAGGVGDTETSHDGQQREASQIA